MKRPNIILASASPRRKDLLHQLDFRFTVCPANIDEKIYNDKPLIPQVRKIATEKANIVAQIYPDELVCGADTIVSIRRRVLGKPKSIKQAVEFLKILSGEKHDVITAVALVCQSSRYRKVCMEKTEVEFRLLTDAEILSYVATGESMDKAGAYAVQGGAGYFVNNITGCYTNIIGFPVPLFLRMIDEYMHGLKQH